MDVKKQTKVIEFLAQNPNSDKTKIVKATKYPLTVVTNILKRLEESNMVTVAGDGKDKSYSMKPKQKKEDKAEAVSAKAGENKPEAAAPEKKDKVENQKHIRDNRTFLFDSLSFKKGPLVRAVVEAFVKKNPKITLAQLKKVFPDSLLHRYGVFAELKEAKKMSGNRDRYFMKPEQTIKLKDATIAVCNQWTSENIKDFLVEARRYFTIK